MPDLRVENLSKSFGDLKALDGVSLEVKDGEYVVILGPSGCGKSTLLKCVAGIIREDKGSVQVAGRRVDQLPPEERGIGYVFQNIALFPTMTVWDNVSYSPRVKGMTPSSYRPLVFEMLDMVRLSVELEQYPSSLSGGTAQKVSLARSLASEVELLLFDEPLSALDTRIRTQLRYELRRIVKEARLTALHVTHDQEEAMAIADRIVVMDQTRIVEVNTPEELYLRPQNEFTARFLGEANVLRADVIECDERGSLLTLGEQTLRGPAMFYPAKGIRTLIVRPEFIVLSPLQDVLEGRVVKKSYAGSYYRFDVELPGGVLLVSKVSSMSPNSLIVEGAQVWLSVLPQHMLIFGS